MLSRICIHKKSFKYWWISAVVGVMSILIGCFCFVAPIDSLAIMAIFFVAFLIVGGIFNIISAMTNKKWNDYWGWDLARGIIEVLLGIWLFILPLPLMATTLVYIFGFWMLFHSVLGICESCELSRLPLKGWGWLLAFNILSLLCSFAFLVTPIYGGIFILLYIGVSFVLYGMFRVILAFRIRNLIKSIKEDEFIEAEEV